MICLVLAIESTDIVSSKLKHIDVSYHKLSEWFALNQIKLSWVASEENIANMFTKQLDRKTIAYLSQAFVSQKQQK